MMSIKIIEASGEEFVYPTTHVNYIPARAKNSVTADASLWFYDHEGRAFEARGLDVFVMNENGRTVARYHLGHDAPHVALPKPPQDSV